MFIIVIITLLLLLVVVVVVVVVRVLSLAKAGKALEQGKQKFKDSPLE